MRDPEISRSETSEPTRRERNRFVVLRRAEPAFDPHARGPVRCAVGRDPTASRAGVGADDCQQNQHASHQSGWALDELVETIRTQGARKTDVVLKDAEGVWLGLINTTQKEATRIASHITEAYAQFLERNELKDGVQLSAVRCHYPEEVPTEGEFLRRLLGDEQSHAA